MRPGSRWSRCSRSRRHVVDERTQTDAEALVAAIAEHGVDMIDTTPSMFAQLRAAGLLTRSRWRCWRWAVKRSAAVLVVHSRECRRTG